MSFAVSCPTCSKTLNVDARLGGQKVTCPNCNSSFVCPAAPAPAPDAGVAAAPPPPAGTAYLGAIDDPLHLPKKPPTKTPPTSALQNPAPSDEIRSVPEILEDILMVLAEDHDLRKQMLHQMNLASRSLRLIALPIVISLVLGAIWFFIAVVIAVG